ncbi:thermonuclease family protein [Bartonella florencae]|uniref:thermonuclease family protein n=1 Tax=Bartonella florencae TaxID=928210 RepID=UPI0002ED071B|nr:thermonuclease family protein [Bartonella florencae]
MTKKSFYLNQRILNLKVIALGIFIAIAIITVYFKYTQRIPLKEDFSSKTVIKGHASIIDGDSIVISSVMIRLMGIDAPELQQFCGKTEARYLCGLEAKKYLEELIANQPVTCYWQKKDKYRRILATCKTKRISNINAMLVRNGWAVSYYDYPEEEQEAKENKNGMWQSHFQRPREWRKAHPRTE